jgi:prepilin-type N-terminal cleavage/methylation domain-containing protein
MTTTRRGMTLLEILLTLVIISILFVPILNLIQQGSKRSYRGGDMTLATIYAADIMELIRGGPYEAFFPDGEKEDKDLTLKEVFGRSNFFKGYDPENYKSDRFEIRVDVGPAGKLSPKKMKQARIKIQWSERDPGRKDPIKHEIRMVCFYSPATL